jgi:hypothetical protein
MAAASSRTRGIVFGGAHCVQLSRRGGRIRWARYAVFVTPDPFRPPPPTPPAALPVVALILAFLGLCLPPLGELGVKGECPDSEVTVACVGNVDVDETLDVWSVSTRDRIGAAGTRVRAGEAMLHVEDTRR